MNEVMKMLRPAPAAFALILIAATAPVDAQDNVPIGNFGDWEAYKESEGGKAVCYLGSQPKKAKGKYKKRGETYILVTHRPSEKSLNVVSIKAGYTYQSGSEVDVVIGAEADPLEPGGDRFRVLRLAAMGSGCQRQFGVGDGEGFRRPGFDHGQGLQRLDRRARIDYALDLAPGVDGVSLGVHDHGGAPMAAFDHAPPGDFDG